MKLLSFLLLVLLSSSVNSQALKLTNKKLMIYYNIINEAENKIVNSDFNTANILYKKAFKVFSEPHAKDLYNSMRVALKIKDLKTAYINYHNLKCLGQNFSESFFNENFKNFEKYNCNICRNKIDFKYKKTLDSLFVIDQHYRRLSGGDYAKYQKEINESDSIVSANLLKLIKQKGFPNEYDIGLRGYSFSPDFHVFIVHQAANNIYGPQQVNFSNEIIKALNKGKIAPDDAAFLIDLSNNTKNYSSKHFDIMQFLKSDKEYKPFEDAIENLKNADCCYVHAWFFPEKRSLDGEKIVREINERRKNLGMCSLDDSLKKKIFNLNNKDYIFPQAQIVGFNFINDKDAENLKKHFIKLK